MSPQTQQHRIFQMQQPLDRQTTVGTTKSGGVDTSIEANYAGSQSAVTRSLTLYTLSEDPPSTAKSQEPISPTESAGCHDYLSSFVMFLFFKNGQEKALGIEAERAVVLAFYQCALMTLLEIVILAFISLYINPMGGVNKKAGFLVVYVVLYILGQLFQAALVFDAVCSYLALMRESSSAN
jgi:hypothetical protein